MIPHGLGWITMVTAFCSLLLLFSYLFTLYRLDNIVHACFSLCLSTVPLWLLVPGCGGGDSLPVLHHHDCCEGR
ncbi:hypothetical protein IWX91DRAFT_343598 [Phyllosticta citricarpa]